MKRIAFALAGLFAAIAISTALSPAALADAGRAHDSASVQLLAAPPAPTAAATKTHTLVLDAKGRAVKTDAQYTDGLLTPISAGGYFTVWVTNPDGSVAWKVKVHNTLANDGANYLRDMFFKGNSDTIVAAAPYVGLLTATPTITTTLLTMTEASVVNGGYVRKQGTWVCSTLGSCNNTASPASWTATAAGTGSIASVTYLFITEAPPAQKGGLFTGANVGARVNAIAYALNDVFTLTANDSKQHTYKVTTAGTTAASQGALYPGVNNEVIVDGTATLTEQGSRFMSFAVLTGGPYTVATGQTLNVTYTWTVA